MHGLYFETRLLGELLTAKCIDFSLLIDYTYFKDVIQCYCCQFKVFLIEIGQIQFILSVHVCLIKASTESNRGSLIKKNIRMENSKIGFCGIKGQFI